MADQNGQIVFWTALGSVATAGSLAYTLVQQSKTSAAVSAPPAAVAPAPPPSSSAAAPPDTVVRVVPAPLVEVARAPEVREEAGGGPSAAASSSGSAAEAASVATRYWSAWSSDNSEALSTLDRLYGEEMEFFGRARSHDYVMHEKSNMVRHWPRREYLVDPSTLETVCQTDGVCNVSGLLHWRTWLQSGAPDNAGDLRFRFGVKAGQIVSEGGTSLR